MARGRFPEPRPRVGYGKRRVAERLTLVTEDEAQVEALGLDLELIGELGRRAAQDQALRSALLSDLTPAASKAAVARLREIDSDNTSWLRQVLQQRGWPGRSMVGDGGARAVWLLAQHADADPTFQAKCLPLLAAAVEVGEAAPASLAYLDDRVRVGRGEPQRYGTQGADGEDGIWRPRPLVDPSGVDQLRANAGLEPLATYVAWMNEHDKTPT